MRALCFRLIARYRQSELAARSAGCCRYSRTCSHYAEDVLTTRALPVALWLVLARVLSCRRPMSRTTRRKVSAVLLLSGIVTLGTAGLAQAVMPPTMTRGGCDATISSRDISSLNRNAPLEVKPGQRVVVAGRAPGGFADRSAPGAETTSSVSVELVSPFSTSFSSDVDQGWSKFESTMNVNRYLNHGSGLYRLTVHATGSAPGEQGWSCSATFYARLEGSDVPGIVAGTLALAGLGGALTSGGKSDWGPDDEAPPGDGPESVVKHGVVDADNTITPDPSGNRRADASALGCAAILLAAIFGLSAGSASAAAPLLATGGEGRRFYRRGHPVRGFFSGLLMGLGITLFMQQRAYWYLTWENAILLPLGLALIFGWRGWRGKAFLISSAAPTTPATPSPAASPTPMPPATEAAPTPPATEPAPMPPVEPPVPPPAEVPPPMPWNPAPEPPGAPEPPRY